MVNDIDRLRDAVVYDSNGDKVGDVGQVYVDVNSQEPTFVTVKTGLFGRNETFVPLDRATQSADGITLPYEKDFIKDAPNIDADGPIEVADEQRIYEYFKMDYHAGAAGTEAGRTGVGTAGDRDTVGDRDSVVVEDEELDVHTERRATGQVRLRKHTYTDTETVEVPVTREEVVVEREPVAPGTAGADADEAVVQTHEEVPVVDKKVNAERVSLGKQEVHDTETVTEDVKPEDVEIDRDR